VVFFTLTLAFSVSLGSEATETIHFAGIDWLVKDSVRKVGPGPNIFSSSSDNVWIDDVGRLHLKISKLKGSYRSAEVVSLSEYGYGMYVFYVSSRVDLLDSAAVAGLFTWDPDANYAHREIDIEFSRWSDPDNLYNAQYMIQPPDNGNRMKRFQMDLQGMYSTHLIYWTVDSVSFRSLHGHVDEAALLTIVDTDPRIIRQWTYTESEIPPAGATEIRINLWLYEGGQPANNGDLELIISDVKYLEVPDD